MVKEALFTAWARKWTDGVPEGFKLRGVFPGSDYLVFSHPPFDYLSENGEVMRRVEDLAWNFDPATIGYAWNEDVCQDYQRHCPEGLIRCCVLFGRSDLLPRRRVARTGRGLSL